MNNEIINGDKFQDAKKRSLSLKAKWSIGTAIGTTLIFAIFAVLLFQSFSGMLLKQDQNNVRNALIATEQKLNNCHQDLTIEDIQRVFNIDYLPKESIKDSPYKDLFIKSAAHEGLTVSVYNRSGQELYATRSRIVQFKKVNKLTEFHFRKKGHTVLLLRKPIISNKTKKVIGYVQISDQLLQYDQSRHKLIILFIVIGITVCFAITLMSYWLSSLLLQPIDILNETIDKINNNEDEGKALSEVRVPVVSKDDELSELSILFNRMLDRMHRYVEQQQQFVGDVSHELRTPVAIIQGHLELLERWGKDDPQVLEESINASLHEIERMKNLVQEMLDLSRAEQVEIQYGKEIADAREVGLQVYNDFQMIHSNFDIVLDNDLDQSTPVKIYRNHLEQILIILLDNAVKYSTNRKEIHLTMSKNSKYVEFVVQDFGEGISQENIQKIFDRFYRVDKARSRNKGGNGLGLSIAHRLVEGYHGSINVESVEGQGSIFKVQLPLAKITKNESLEK